MPEPEPDPPPDPEADFVVVFVVVLAGPVPGPVCLPVPGPLPLPFPPPVRELLVVTTALLLVGVDVVVAVVDSSTGSPAKLTDGSVEDAAETADLIASMVAAPSVGVHAIINIAAGATRADNNMVRFMIVPVSGMGR